MRIGIDARPLQLDAYKDRGIGTHLRGWIEAAQALSTTSSFTLLFDPKLSAPRVNLTSPQWSLRPLALPFAPTFCPPTELHVEQADEFQFDSAVESMLLDQGFDVFHATYNFMWETYVPRRLYHTRWVVTVYDLIPLIFQDEYLSPLGERGRQSFAQRLGASLYAQRTQTISAATKQDVVKFAGVPADTIDVVYGGIDPAFRPLPANEVEKEIGPLGITRPYIFAVAGFHHTKNLRRQFQAISLLPSELANQFQFVILYPGQPSTTRVVREWLAEFNIADRTILLDRGISQNQLVALYNGATLVLHATLFEGLGLPVLEAMRCGTPVVTSNTSSMPEVAGEAAELVNPYQPGSIAHGLGRVLASATLRNEMRERGFEQAAPFTWERTAQAVLASYESTAAGALSADKVFFPAPTISTSKRWHLSFWSPVNPRPSGVSDYSELLLAELGKHADVDVYLDGYQPENLPLFDSFAMYDGQAYPYVARRRPYDMNLYQVGNNPLHRYMYRPIVTWPGIVTFHDICIYHFIHAALVKDGRADEFWQEVAFCEGAAVANRAKVDYMTGKLDDYLMPLNKRLVLASRGVITHSAWGMRQLQQYDGAPPGRVVPFGMMLLEEDGQRFGQLVRRLLDLPTDAFIFGVFGNLHRVKRVSVVLRAFERVRARYPKAVLFLMGPIDSSVAEVLVPLQRDPQRAKAQGVHMQITYASYDLMLMAMQAIDVGVNLRFPTAGETSGTLSMLMGQGKPTLVSAIGSFTEYPDACCPKIDVNDQEESDLVQRMMQLIEDQTLYRRATEAAFEYAQKNTWSNCAHQYLELIEQIKQTTRPAVVS